MPITTAGKLTIPGRHTWPLPRSIASTSREFF